MFFLFFVVLILDLAVAHPLFLPVFENTVEDREPEVTELRPVAALRSVKRFSEEEKEKNNNRDRTERVVLFPPLPPAGAAYC